MLLLVATKDTQGLLPDDYCNTVDGELVSPLSIECCSPDACGCGRGFPGFASSRATTTAIVANVAGFTTATLRDCIGDWLRRTGWSTDIPADLFDQTIDEQFDAIVRIAAVFEEGDVVRRKGSSFWATTRCYADLDQLESD